MSNSNAVITFDGLLVFCFAPKTCQGSPDIRDRCDIGVLHETGGDIHEFSIKVYKEMPDGSSMPAEPHEFGMPDNPLIYNQSALKGLSSFHLYVGDCEDGPPESGSVIRESSFDAVLNLNGEDFYQGGVKILWGKFTPLRVTAGSFAGVNGTGDAEFCRVSADVLQVVQNTLMRPNDWYTLLDSDRRMLGTFARKMKTEIEIGQGKYLIAKAESSSGVFETLFCLPYPGDFGVNGYVLEVNNLDPVDLLDITSPDHIVNNCANFTHLCEAIEVPHLVPHPVYGLTYNFDFVYLNDDELNEDVERCDDACCIGCELG